MSVYAVAAGALAEFMQTMVVPHQPIGSSLAETIARDHHQLDAVASPLTREPDELFLLAARDGSVWVLKIASPYEDPVARHGTGPQRSCSRVRTAARAWRAPLAGCPECGYGMRPARCAVEVRANPSTGLDARREAARIVNSLRRQRVLIGTTGYDSNVLKIRPPPVFGPRVADFLLDRLRRALAA